MLCCVRECHSVSRHCLLQRRSWYSQFTVSITVLIDKNSLLPLTGKKKGVDNNSASRSLQVKASDLYPKDPYPRRAEKQQKKADSALFMLKILALWRTSHLWQKSSIDINRFSSPHDSRSINIQASSCSAQSWCLDSCTIKMSLWSKCILSYYVKGTRSFDEKTVEDTFLAWETSVNIKRQLRPSQTDSCYVWGRRSGKNCTFHSHKLIRRPIIVRWVWNSKRSLRFGSTAVHRLMKLRQI